MSHLTCDSSFLLGVLPARWGSSRFPGKPLHVIAGKPLIQHVWERCKQAKLLEELVVATDDERIAQAVSSFGGKAVMTSIDHPTGTDRLAEAISFFPQATHVINIQGDEPLIDIKLIDEIGAALLTDSKWQMVTAANPMAVDDPDVLDPNVVKVVMGLDGRALYFSRSAIPFSRQQPDGLTVFRHKGIYGYRRAFLEQFIKWQPTALECAESLEQLRALEHGAQIKVLTTLDTSPGVDTLEQAQAVELLLQSSTHFSS